MCAIDVADCNAGIVIVKSGQRWSCEYIRHGSSGKEWTTRLLSQRMKYVCAADSS